jgi:hypothetical protein
MSICNHQSIQLSILCLYYVQLQITTTFKLLVNISQLQFEFLSTRCLNVLYFCCNFILSTVFVPAFLFFGCSQSHNTQNYGYCRCEMLIIHTTYSNLFKLYIKCSLQVIYQLIKKTSNKDDGYNS